jgi:hypothetical protein
MSVGSARTPFEPIGSNLPDADNNFCRDCNRILHVRKGSPGETLVCTRQRTRQVPLRPTI